MRWIFGWMAAAALAVPGPGWCEDIVQVLHRSQQVRLDGLAPAASGSERAERVRHVFKRLVQALELPVQVQLRVVRSGTLAETLTGHVVVVSEELADLPEQQQLFILAHELGHVALGHASQMGLLFQKWVPGAVVPEKTDPVAALLGRDASALAHRQEFEADAFAAHTLNALGQVPLDALALFARVGAYGDTATHPSARKRLAALRALAAQPQAVTRNELIESVSRPD